MIPLVNPALARQSSAVAPWLSGPIRWIVVVLALVATLDAAYLTWSSFSHGVVSGCDGLGQVDCDAVLTSGWSRVVGVPVALGGLLCYAAILVLGLAAGSPAFNSNRWLGTALAALALVAAAAGIWFTLVQVFALGKFCYYCLGIHLCGVAIAALVLWSALVKRPQPLGASRSHSALVAAIPGAAGTRRVAGPRPAEGPSLRAAWPVAGALVAVLIAAQVMFPSKTFQISTPALGETFDMTAADNPSADKDALSPDAQEHVVNRVSTEDEPGTATNDERTAEKTADASARETKNDEAADGSSSIVAAESSNEPPALTRAVKLLQGRLKMNVYDEAVLGSPDAKYVVVELMDYTCPHCRKMHAHIREAIDRYGDQLAIVIMPVPLELECNKLIGATDPMHRGACKMAKTALAIAKIDPVKFSDFHNFLLADEEKPPTAAQAVGRAFRLVNSRELTNATSGNNINDRIQKYIKLYSNLSAEHRGAKETFGLPVQIIGDTVLSGGEITSEEMFEAWEKALGIKPQ